MEAEYFCGKVPAGALFFYVLGSLGTGDADWHSRCAHWLRNDRVSMECGAWQAGDREGRPYGGLQGVPCGRADRVVRPYGG